jgi:hypothetical protein
MYVMERQYNRFSRGSVDGNGVTVALASTANGHTPVAFGEYERVCAEERRAWHSGHDRQKAAGMARVKTAMSLFQNGLRLEARRAGGYDLPWAGMPEGHEPPGGDPCMHPFHSLPSC